MLMQNRAPQRCKADSKTTQNLGVYSFFGKKRGFSPRCDGFSLIELLVVISIIGLVLGIGTAVALKMTTEARRTQTRAMMNGLLSANDQYKSVHGTEISHTEPIAGLSSTEQYVEACLTIKACEEIMMSALSSASSAALERTYKDGTVFDRWGTEIEYRTSNDPRSATPTPPANQAGDTVANSVLPLSSDPFFASAGPDETWDTDDDITTLQQ